MKEQEGTYTTNKQLQNRVVVAGAEEVEDRVCHCGGLVGGCSGRPVSIFVSLASG